MRCPSKATTKNTTIAKDTSLSFGKSVFAPFVAIVAVVVAFVTPADASVIDPELRIVIRTYDASSAAGDLAHALDAARAILEDAGIAMTWVMCDVGLVRLDQNPCLAPLAANELAIRFVRLPAHVTEQDLVTLGDSLVDTQLRAGSLATIYVNRVSALAARCRIDLPTLLGRAVAHEIGHLLLGTSAHASSGLMRAVWSPTALRRGAVDEWMFTAADAETMRDAVRMRIARRMASARLGE